MEEVSNWSIANTIATSLAVIVAGLYTVITYSLFKQTKNANQVSVYFTLKKELSGDFFTKVSNYCSRDSIEIKDMGLPKDFEGYNLLTEILYVERTLFIRDVLGNIEDLAMLYQKNILELGFIDTGYGYQILFIGNNEKVRSLLRDIRKDFPDACGGFEDLYEKIWQRLTPSIKLKYKKTLFDK